MLKHKTITRLAVACVLFSQSVLAADTPQVGDDLEVIELYWAKTEPREIARRVMFAATLMTEREIKLGALEGVMRDSESTNRWISPFEDAEELKVKIVPDYNEIRIFNRKLADSHEGPDVGEEKAIEIAKGHIKQLMESKVLDHRDLYELNDVQVGYSKFGEGSIDLKQQYESVVEYRLTFRPNVRGVQLANAGVRVAVHRSGKISGIRFGGVSVKQKQGKMIKRNVLDEQIEEQFRQSIPKYAEPVVAWSRIMYAMPEDKRTAIVEPLKLYAYSQKTKSDGEEIISRRKIVGFSLSDEKAALVDFTAPARAHSGTKVTRKESE